MHAHVHVYLHVHVVSRAFGNASRDTPAGASHEDGRLRQECTGKRERMMSWSAEKM